MKRKFKSVVSIVLSVMMIISMASIGFMTANAAEEKFNIYFNAGGNSKTVNIYAWYGSNSEVAGKWPGTGMTSVGNNRYGIQLDANAAKVIFNDGNNKYYDGDITLPTNWANLELTYSSDGTAEDKDGNKYKADGTMVGGVSTADYYIVGRFGVKSENGTLTYVGGSENAWSTSAKDIKLSKSSDNLYSIDTGYTMKELASHTGGNTWYFRFYDGSSTYCPNSDTPLTIADQGNSYPTGTANQSFHFTGDDESGSVIIWLDTSGSVPAFYFTISGQETEPGEISLKDDTAVNGSLSFKAADKKDGTADIADVVTITANPFAGFTCTDITVSYTDTNGAPQETKLTATNNVATFTVPDVQPNEKGKKSISFAATFALDKASYLSSKGDGLWIDVAPSQNDSTATLIKWNNYYSYNHNTSTNPYTFYVPKNVDLSSAKIYNGYSSEVTVAGTAIPAKSFGTVSLSVSNGISVSGISGVSSIKVMQGSTNAMFLYTTKKGVESALPTETYAAWNAEADTISKGDVKTDVGSCVTMTNDTSEAVFTNAKSVDSVKGRGNSSWEASAKRFGKFAYNMKLSEKTNLFGMDKAKSWCLLANNADESMLRNALAYKLADDAGLYNSPEFSFVDIYDNGEYMGSYLVTEKVDVGNSKLVKGESIEDINEDAGLIFDEDSRNRKNGSVDGKNYEYCYTTVTNEDYTEPDISNATYLLEFEIDERYLDEACWFTTPKGQHVVIKTPEFATEAQVKFIAEKFIAMEAKVFENANNAELSKHMDLDSFARMYLVQEISSNLDSAATSYYVTYDCSKGDNSRFVASPVWDYDWAFGQYGKTDAKYDVNNKPLNPKATDAWFAKNKRMDDSSLTSKKEYSIQSKLANNTDFQKVIKKVWDGTDTQEGFYAKAQKYYGENSQLDAWYNLISASVNMNETRWGFIKNNNITDWGSSNTGDTHQAAVNYLENEFLGKRADWLDGEFSKYSDYEQIAAPTLTGTLSDGTELPAEGVAVGTELKLKATTTESFVTYELYNGSDRIDTNNTGEFTVKPSSKGTYNYTVKTVYNTSDVKSSNEVTVTVTGEDPVELTGVTLTADKTEITEGETITLTATPEPAELTNCTYTFYNSNDEIVGSASTSNTASVKLDVAGTYSYYVKAVCNGVEKTSNVVTVNVKEQTFELTGVTLKADKTTVTPGTTVTLTANPIPAKVTDCTYTFYNSKDEVVSAESTSNTASVKLDTVGTYSYYVKAFCNGVEKISNTVKVTVAEQQEGVHTVKVWFKGASSVAYTPSVSLDGGSYKTMSRIKLGTEGSTYFGSTYSGSLKFYWYFADVEIDSATTHTLTFKTAGTSVRATSEPNNFNSDEYYFAVDNLMDDTKLVDLTNEPEYIRNYHRSAVHMVYNDAVRGDSTLGFTYIDGVEYPMGKVLDSENKAESINIQTAALSSRLMKVDIPSAASVGASNATFTIESATLTQKLAAGIIGASELQQCLLDVNLDAQVDIRDVTLMQKALAQ